MLEQIASERYVYASRKSDEVERDTLRRQRRDEFQAKTETVAGADNSGQARVNRHIKLDLKQITRVEQDASVQNHAAFAQLGSATFDDGG